MTSFNQSVLIFLPLGSYDTQNMFMTLAPDLQNWELKELNMHQINSPMFKASSVCLTWLLSQKCVAKSWQKVATVTGFLKK